MTLKLRLSTTDGSFHEGSSTPTSKRAPTDDVTDAEIIAHSQKPMTVAEYGAEILSERAKQDPAYRRELDARLAAGQAWGDMGRALTAPQDATAQIKAMTGAPDAIIARGIAQGPMTREERMQIVSSAAYKTSEDARALHDVRLCLGDAE